MVIHSNLILLVFVSLLNDALNHSHALHKIFIVVSCHQHIQRLVLINLFSVIDARFALRASAPDLDLAARLFLELLLGLTLRPYNLTNIVYGGVVWIRDVNALILLGRLIVRGRLIG